MQSSREHGVYKKASLINSAKVENYGMGKMRDFSKKIEYNKQKFHAKTGMIKRQKWVRT